MNLVKMLVAFMVLVLISVIANAGEIDKNISVGGFVSQGYLKTTDNNRFSDSSEDGSFAMTESAINIMSKRGKVTAGAQLFMRQLGDIGKNEVTLDWAYATYHWKDELKLSVGKQKIQMGFYNHVRDIPMTLPWVIAPLLYNDNFREYVLTIEGVGIHGSLDFNNLGILDYTFNIGISQIPNDGGISKHVKNLTMNTYSIDEFKVGETTNYSVVYSPVYDLKLSASQMISDVEGYLTSNLDGSKTTSIIDPLLINIYGISYSFWSFQAVYEYSNASMTQNVRGVEYEIERDTWYAMLIYNVNNNFRISSYYSELESNDRDITPHLSELQDYQNDISVNFEYDITQNLNLKTQIIKSEGCASLYMLDNPDGFEEEWWTFTTKITVDF